MTRVANIDLFGFFIEQARKEGKIKKDEQFHINAEVAPELSKGIEQSYHHLMERFIGIGYELQLAKSIKDGHTPKSQDSLTPNGSILQYGFFNFDELPTDKKTNLNKRLYSDVLAWAFAEICELYAVYMDYLHDVGFVLKNGNLPITMDAIIRAKKYFKKPLEQKINILDEEYGFSHPYQKEILTMYAVRNIYAHSDSYFSPVPREKNLEITWLSHTPEFCLRATGKWVSENNIPRPFTGDEFSEVRFKFFDGDRVNKRYLDKQGMPNLNEQDIREICHFFLYIFEIYHQQLISYASRKGLQMCDFETYRCKLQINFLIVPPPPL